MSRSRLISHVAALLLTGSVLAAGCSGDSGERGVAAGRFAEVSEDSLTTKNAVPAPTGAVVVVVTGALSRPNVDSSVEFDMATLERLGLHEGVVFEPWEKIDMRFTGVALERLLDSVGASASATSIHLTALDDYQVDISMAEIRSGSIILATRQDSAPIAVDKGGPTRIVYGSGTTSGENPDQWIWSVAKIEIRE
jgi:hypothetical protein